MLTFISTLPIALLLTGAALIICILMFLAMFAVPGALHLIRLNAVVAQLKGRNIGGAKDGVEKSLHELGKVFSKDPQLTHLWREYRETLHLIREERDGVVSPVGIRSTVPAEMYFSAAYIVESRLRTEFFKHLPGILTGLGIIGTFSGLIEGVANFPVSSSPDVMRPGLQSLLHSVGEAFLISAIAIGLAMAVTFTEKILLSALYRRSERIAHGIDALFVSGAGEEYLSRLVKASEDSASQTKILKDALVRELGDLLRELTSQQLELSRQHHAGLLQGLSQSSQRQIDASKEDSVATRDAITRSIEEGLKGPIDKMVKAAETASGDQSSAAVQMLQDVMLNFSQKLNDLFGDQISGINQLNAKAAQGLQDAVGALQSALEGMKHAGQETTDAMAKKMAEAIQKMEERQASMNAEAAAFSAQLRDLAAKNQTETSEKIQSSLTDLGSTMKTIMEALKESQDRVFEANAQREADMTSRASNMVSNMSDTSTVAAKALSDAADAMRKSVDALSHSTATSIDKMSVGAEVLNAALQRFSSAGSSVSNVMELAAKTATKLSDASSQLSTGADAVLQSIKDYQLQREAMAGVLNGVKETVALASREASITKEVVERIDASAKKLAIAHEAADVYLAGVTKVLEEAHESFAKEVVKTLGRANTEFHSKLSSAVALLSSSIQELEASLGPTAAGRK